MGYCTILLNTMLLYYLFFFIIWRCLYSNGYSEDLSLKEIQTLSRLHPLHQYFKNIKPKIDDTDNIPFYSTVKSNMPKPSDTYSKPKTIDNHSSFVSQNVQSSRSEAQSINLDAIIEMMIKNNISIYSIQETWLDGDFVKEINGYTMFHHGLVSQTCSRGQKGVAIILSPGFL